MNQQQKPLVSEAPHGELPIIDHLAFAEKHVRNCKRIRYTDEMRVEVQCAMNHLQHVLDRCSFYEQGDPRDVEQ